MIRRTACLIARHQEPCRNLAIEKHLMDTLPEDTAILFLWQNRRAIVVGRNQNLWDECRADDFTAAGGQLARRLSGGGAFYHDAGSLGFSLLTPKTAFDIAFQMRIVAAAVGAFGVQARAAGRASLYAEERKFGANAFYKAGSAAVHHGSLLFNCDLAAMQRCLTLPQDAPAPTLVNLRSLVPELTLDMLEESLFWAFARAYGAQPAWLDERILDSRTIDALTAQFADENWINPETPPCGFRADERFPWGALSARLRVEGGVIRAARLYTDAMEAPLFGRLERALTGSPLLISAIAGRFEQHLRLLTDQRLLRVAWDVCDLICRRIRTMDEKSAG